MNIELIRQTFDCYDGYKYKPFEWCCEKLKNNPIINLVCEYTDECEDTITPSISIRFTESFYDWGDEYEEETYYKLTHCPFCGEPIVINVIGEEDVTEKYVELHKERDKMWKKYTRTDSKKKEAELRKVVYELDDKVNYFHNLSEYKNIEEM